MANDLQATAFVAYPSAPKLVTDAIDGAVELAQRASLTLYPWQKMPILGLKLDNLIQEKILERDCLVADITIPNFNVYYEIGYALALEKPIVLTVNVALGSALLNVKTTGLFDNIGWLEYTNSTDLFEKLKSWTKQTWVERYERSKDHAQPLFILDTLIKTDFRQYIFQAVEHRSVNFRIFDPMEVPRLTASKAITEISSSAGCIIPIIDPAIVDSELHNLRAAFLIGLAHGYDIEPMIIQYGNGPAPTDYRDYITNTNSRTETHRHIEDYCGKVLVRNQAQSSKKSRFALGLLNKVDLGSSAAENESISLSGYFVDTAEFSRAMRAEHALIVGRKGSGKTAIFYQVRNSIRKDKYNFIVELRPSTHNLSELRHELLAVSNQGIFDHTIAAFWNYIIYVEILLKVREYVLPHSQRDFDLQNRIRELEEELRLDPLVVSGDFTSRLNSAIADVLDAIRSDKSSYRNGMKSITNIVYEESIPKLRDILVSFSDFYDEISIFIDDIDKGWPPRQLEEHDVLTIRHLIESLRRIERDLRRKDIKFRSLMFLRGDVYENLVDNTSDRGKYNAINIDWSDQSQLIRLLKKRVMASFDAESEGNQAWEAINVVMPDGHHAIEKLIEASLYRPRFLIEACEKVLSTAINRGNAFVTPQDVERGLQQMSEYLVSDFGYELRDVSGIPESVFYRFIGSSRHLTRSEIESVVAPLNIDWPINQIVDLFLWYGFLGVVTSSGTTSYIFDTGYDYRRLQALRGEEPDEVLYEVNEAFLRGLQPQ